MKIDVVNYEIIEKADIQIDGITLLLGPSNNGKSSLMRAIKSVLYGRQGDDYVRFGTHASSVSISFDEHFIVRTKSKSALVYYIDGQKYEKIGRTRPTEIESLFNYKLIEFGGQSFKPNFYDPDEPLFLVRYTPSERFAYLSLVIEESKFGEIVKSIVDTNKAASKSISALETQIKLLDDEVRERTVEMGKFTDIVPYFQLIDTIEKSEDTLDDLTDWKAGLVDIDKHTVELGNQMRTISDKLTCFVDLTPQIKLLKQLLSFSDGLQQTSFVTRIAERCDLMSNCVGAYKDQQLFLSKGLIELRTFADKMRDLTQLRDAYISLDKACEFLRKEAANLGTQLDEIRANLTECPLCGSALDETKKSRILKGEKK